MFPRLLTPLRSRDEAPITDTPATPTVVVDATIRPPSPLDALLESMSIGTPLTAPQSTGSIFGPFIPLPSQHLPEDAVESAISPPSLAAPHTCTPVVSFSIPSSSQHLREEEDTVTEFDAAEGVRNTAYGQVSVSWTADSSNLTLKLRRNAVQIPPLEEEEEDEQEQEREEVQPSLSEADLLRGIQESERVLQKLRGAYEKMDRRNKKPSRSILRRTFDDEPEDLPFSVKRNGRTEHRATPYPRPRNSKPKGQKNVRLAPIYLEFVGPRNDDATCPVPPAPISEVPTVHKDSPYYRPPTPHPSAMTMPEYDLDEQEWVSTRPNTPVPTNYPIGLGLDVSVVVRTPTVEKIDNVEDDDDRPSIVAPADAQDVTHAVTPELLSKADAFLTETLAELQSVASAGPTPPRSTPGLYADSISEGPTESPLPRTPLVPPGGIDSEVAVRSPKPPGYEEVFGRSDDEDSDDALPTPRPKSEKTATTENADTTPSQRTPIPTLPLAPTPAESVIGTDIPTQPSSSAMHAVPPQREMSWTTLPVSSPPATAPQIQPLSAFAQPYFAWGQPIQHQAAPTSWSQSTIPAPLSTSTWMAPPQSAPAFYQPVTIPQFSTVVQHAVPPQAQAEVDMSMDVDPFADVAPPRPRRRLHPRGRDYRRIAHDHKRAARQLLRVAAVEPSVDLRKRAARRMFAHLFAIRQRPVPIHPFQGERAMRKSAVVQRRNRDALRHARRSVRPVLRRLGRVARSSRSAPQSIQRSMSVDMTAECAPVGVFEEDIDMDGGDLAAMPAIDNAVEMMAAETAFNCKLSVPLLPPSVPTMPVGFAIPAIVITPNSPLPQQQQQSQPQESLRTACLRPCPPPPMSFVPEPTVPAASDSAKYDIECPPREQSSVAEFEVPLVDAAAPASASDPESAAEVEPTPAAAAVPEAVVESQRSSEDNADALDDETEWEPVPVPAVPVNAPAIPSTEPAPEEENTSDPNPAAVEHENASETQDLTDVPAPNIAESGPEIVFHSYKPGKPQDDDDAVSLGNSEDEAERQAIYGADGEYGEEDYEDDEDDEDYEGDEEEEDDEEETEEETEEEDEQEENNEYDENAPINGPVRRTPAPTPTPTPSSAPATAPVSSPAVAASPVKASTLLPTPSTLAPSPAPTSLTGGPYIGSVGERYEESAVYARSMHLLANTANVSSGASNRLSGAAAQEARAQARLRNHANQLQQRKTAQDLIRSIVAKSAPVAEATPSHGPFTTTPSGLPVKASNARVEQHGLDCPPQTQDRVMSEAHTRAEEYAELVFPRPDKGKGKATHWEDSPITGAFDVDPSTAEIVGGLGLTPEEVRLNVDAFPRTDSNIEAAPSYECGCRRLSNGPSSGHTLACQNARCGLPLASKTSVDSGFGSSVAASPMMTVSPLGTRHDSKPPKLEVSSQIERSQSMTETDVSTDPVDQRKWQSTQPSTCLPTTFLPAAPEQSSPATELVKDDTDQRLTAVAKAWDDLFTGSTMASTAEQGLPDAQAPWLPAPDCAVQPLHASNLPPATIDPSVLNLSAEVQEMFGAIVSGSTFTQGNEAMDQEIFFLPPEIAPAAGLDFSALASGLDAGLALEEQLRDMLSSIPNQDDFVDIDDFIVNDSAPQDVASTLPVSADVDGCTPAIFSQVPEGDNVAAKEGRQEVRKIEAEIVSYPLETPSNVEQQDQSSEPCFVNYPVVEAQPQLESDIPVLAAASARPDTRTEAGLQDENFSQLQPPSEQLLPAHWVPQGSVEVAVPLPPARVPIPPLFVPQNEIAHPVAEEHTKELEHVNDPSSSCEPEAEDESPAPDVPTPPSTPLVRRRSGGPHDRIACSHEKRTYFGPRPSAAQWQAFLQASPPRVNRLLFSPPRSVANKSLSPSPSPIASLPYRPNSLSRLSTPSTPPDASTIAKPAQPRLPSRGRPRRRSTVLTAVDEPKFKKDVAAPVAQADTFPSVIEKRKRGERKGTKEIHPSSTSSARHPSCLPLSNCPRPSLIPSLPSWLKPPCCPNFSQTGREPCIHALRASGRPAGTRWESESESESPDSDLEEEKDTSWPQGWSASYLAKLSLAAGACFLLESIVF